MWRDRLGVFLLVVLFALFVGTILVALIAATIMDARGEMAPLPFPPSPGTQPSSLVAHWKMDDNTSTSTITDSAGSYDGTLYAGAVEIASSGLTTTGLIGSALVFSDASDHEIDFGSPAALYPSGAMSVALWFRTTDAYTNALISWAGSEHRITAINATNRIGFTRGNAPTYLNYINWTVPSPYLHDGEWHHIVVVVPDREAQSIAGILCYLDGKALSVVASAATDPVETGSSLGVVVADGIDDAVFDDIRFYNAVLSQANVTWLYNYGIGRTY